MFTSAREVLAKQTETDASSRGDDSTRARDANAPKPSSRGNTRRTEGTGS